MLIIKPADPKYLSKVFRFLVYFSFFKNLIKKSKKHLVDKDVLLSDIVYSPKETEFLKMFPKNKKIYGISMLLHQAIPCFKLWFGFNPSVDTKLIKILDKKIK